MAVSIGPWNKWGDPLAGGNRLCRESLLTQTARPHAAGRGAGRAKRPEGLPAPLPRGERGVWGSAPWFSAVLNFAFLVTRKVSPKSGKRNVIRNLRYRDYE